MRQAVRLEWLTVAYLISAVFFIYLTLGSSQAMKTAWFEDILSLIPAAAFLCAALALFCMGAFLLFDAVSALLTFEHPTIGTVVVLGQQVWLGWLMLPALLWSAVPAAALGRAKPPLGEALHDKVLHADATMNKADWMTAGAAMVGVLGIGLGLWWADAVAAAVISLDILHDGVKNLRAVISDLMDSEPTTVDHSGPEALPHDVERRLRGYPWVAQVEVRMREEGHVFFGEAFVVPADNDGLAAKIEQAVAEVLASDWRLHDL
ncbi:MAG: cation transporter [Actinomycetota bacterium]|nr:cation transporter [Actinomycetota bacterium]